MAPVIVLMALLLVPVSASASLPKILTEAMPGITQWVYRNGAIEDPYPCEEVCKTLWTKQHEPEGAFSQETWNDLGQLETIGTHLWGSVSGLHSTLGDVELGPLPLRIGWHIANKSGSAGSKWMAITGPTEPGLAPECNDHWETMLFATGEQIGETFYAVPDAPGNEWYLRICNGTSSRVRQPDAKMLNPEEPSKGCPGYGLYIFGWFEQEWQWNHCAEGYDKGEPVFAPVFAQAFYQPFNFTQVEEWEGQSLEHNVTTYDAEDPGLTSVEKATEEELLHGSMLRETLAWTLGGESGPNPDGISGEEEYGSENEGIPKKSKCMLGFPVNCATGNQTDTQTDITVGGRGPGLSLARTYNSQLAAHESSPGPFGYGWTGPYSAYLEMNTELQSVTVHQSNGSTVRFMASGELWVPANPQAQATLAKEGSGYTYTLPDQRVLHFNSAGQLTSEVDRNGNSLVMAYNSEKALESVTDGSGRQLTFAYNGEGLVESVKDPMGHAVKYGYESDNLVSVTEPGEAKANWRFKYDSSHQMTEEIDGRGNAVSTEYDGSHRVISQTDGLSRKRVWKYASTEAGSETTVTEPNGSTTVEKFNLDDEPTSVTHASGTSIVQTTTDAYDSFYNLVATTDPDGHTVRYGYDPAGDRTSETNALGETKQWSYDSHHDVVATTTPEGETTTIVRDGNGNPETISRPAPGEKTQVTTYKYDSYGDLTSVTDPLERTTKYEYDSYGDRIAEIDPEGDKRTWAYNKDSQEISMVSPRGNVGGGDPAGFTTTIERDAQGRPVLVTEPEVAGVSVPVNKAAAVISGAAQEGATLTAGRGVWEGSSSLSYSYQWQACNAAGGECFDVPGSTDPTLYLSSEGVGYTLRVVVTASDSAGSASSTSVATTVVSVSPPPVFASAFGSSGSGDGQFTHPVGVAVDPHGDVWVTDAYDSRVEKFSSSGSWLASYGKLGLGDGEYFEPVGIAINQSTGDVYVVDQYTGKVQELNEKGEWLRSWEGSDGSFEEPSGIAIDSKGDVWVTDYGNDRVEEFSEAGVFLSKFGSAGSEGGEFLGPAGVLVANGYVYVTDFASARLEGFGEGGEYLAETGGWGIGIGDFVYPYGLAASASGNVYVDELGNDRIQELSPYGSFVALFGSSGSGPGQLSEPHDLAFGSSGELYVTDSENNRVEKWVPAGGPVDSMLPSISGELRVGQTISAETGVWSADPAPSYTYQWQRCNGSGESCSNVSGATGSTYAVGSADAGHTLRVVVSATNSGGTTSSTSGASEVIARGRSTEYVYDAAGNLESVTDPDGQKTTYAYDADNEQVKVEAPSGTVTETEYDDAGQVVSQTDGNKHVTKYVRNALEEVTEVIDSLGKKTTKEYDAAGNMTSLIDPEGRTASYGYDPANRLIEVKYSDGKTPTVKYEYDEDGNRTVMSDGTGTTTYTYDQLGRLTEAKDGHGDATKYEYDLANEQTKITYPNGKSITRAYNEAGRLEKVTDWSEHTTKFQYDPDGDLTATIFPSETTNEDKYAYNDADMMSEAKMLKGTETLASLTYARDNDGQLTATTSKGLPGVETFENMYDPDGRLTKAGSVAYEYDVANNPTKIGAGAYKYNDASQLETGPGTTYAYNELGERTKTTPGMGPATTYGYDEAGNLTAVERPKEGETPKIEDAYGYNGEGLQVSQSISGTTNYLTWDPTEGLPLILGDGANSYIYGPGDMPIEQINNTTGTVEYLHHDQQGSTRLLTGSTGKVEGTYTYTPYGAVQEHTGTATTPLGYDGQYTSTDTGLIYLRARSYDPGTAQFLSVDPLVGQTHAPYNYADDNPLNEADPTGLGNWLNLGLPSPGEVAETLNPIKYYEEEIESYENGCGYFASVAHGLEGAVVGALDASGLGEEEAAGAAGDEAAGGSQSLGLTGQPNSTEVLDRGNGSGQIRDYGPDGSAQKDFDFGHDHGAGDPHAHDWVEGIRQPGRPIGPGE
jgi:RHS repeat-associated protein